MNISNEFNRIECGLRTAYSKQRASALESRETWIKEPTRLWYSLPPLVLGGPAHNLECVRSLNVPLNFSPTDGTQSSLFRICSHRTANMLASRWLHENHASGA